MAVPLTANPMTSPHRRPRGVTPTTAALYITLLGGALYGAGCGDGAPPQNDASLDAALDATLDVSPDRDGDIAPLGRVLILDQAFRPITTWTRVMAAISEAGLEPEYRRYYPHLTEADVQPSEAGGALPYPIIILAAGYAPHQPHDVLRFGEVQLARTYAAHGGTLVLATTSALQDSATGSNDWFVQNRILEELEVGIRIERGLLLGDVYSGDPAPPHTPGVEGYPTTLESTIGYAFVRPTPFHPTANRIVQLPLGNAGPLSFNDPTGQVLLRTHPLVFSWGTARMDDDALTVLTEPAVVSAIAPAMNGFVMVMPRTVLTMSAVTGQLSDKPALDTTYGTTADRYLHSLLQWLWEVTEQGDLGERIDTGHADALFRVAAPDFPPLAGPGDVQTSPFPVSTREVATSPPAGDLYEALPPSAAQPMRPSWMSPDRGRIGYAGLPPQIDRLDRLFTESREGGLDALMTTMEPEALLDPDLDEGSRAQIHERFRRANAEAVGSEIQWFIGGFLNGYRGILPRTLVASTVGVHGQHFSAPAAVDPHLWASYLHPLCSLVGELAAEHTEIDGFHLDLELYGGPIHHSDGFAFSETTVAAFLEAWRGEDLSELGAEARADRYHWLVDRGRLGDYLHTLEELVYDKALRCRELAHASAPRLQFMLYTAGFPDGWFYEGLLRGLGSEDRPVTTLSYEAWSEHAQDVLAGRGIFSTHLAGTLVGYWRPQDLRSALASIAEPTDGYWFLSVNDISATHLMPPALHGEPGQYWDAIRDANEDLTGL